MSEDEELFTRKLKRFVTPDQISAVAHASDNAFERLASFVKLFAREQGVGDSPAQKRPKELPMY